MWVSYVFNASFAVCYTADYCCDTCDETLTFVCGLLCVLTNGSCRSASVSEASAGSSIFTLPVYLERLMETCGSGIVANLFNCTFSSSTSYTIIGSGVFTLVDVYFDNFYARCLCAAEVARSCAESLSTLRDLALCVVCDTRVSSLLRYASCNCSIIFDGTFTWLSSTGIVVVVPLSDNPVNGREAVFEDDIDYTRHGYTITVSMLLLPMPYPSSSSSYFTMPPLLPRLSARSLVSSGWDEVEAMIMGGVGGGVPVNLWWPLIPSVDVGRDE